MLDIVQSLCLGFWDNISFVWAISECKLLSLFSIHFRLKIGRKLLHWLNFGHVNRVDGVLYESIVLLAKELDNYFLVIIAAKVWVEDVITVVVKGTDVGDETMVIAFLYIPSPIDSEIRLSDERTTQTFQSYSHAHQSTWLHHTRYPHQSTSTNEVLWQIYACLQYFMRGLLKYSISHFMIL